MKILLLFFALSLFQTCRNQDPEDHVMVVSDAGKMKRFMMYLNHEHDMKEIVILENTINDTARLWRSGWLLPGQTGVYYRGECFMDSMPFLYEPYRATKGRVVFRYRSWKSFY